MWVLISDEPDAHSEGSRKKVYGAYSPTRYGYYWMPKQYHPHEFGFFSSGGPRNWLPLTPEQIIFGMALEVRSTPHPRGVCYRQPIMEESHE